MDLARAPHHAPLTARKKGSGYENVFFPEMANTSGGWALLELTDT
jgi:hypothetical protein